MARSISEHSKYWRAPSARNMELLAANYVTHTFAKHTHDEYVVGVMESGVEEFSCRGAIHRAAPGSIVLVNPGDVHTGSSATEDGWQYRAMYPSPALITEILEASTGRRCKPPFFPNPVVCDQDLARELRLLHLSLELSSDPLEQEIRLYSTFIKLVARHSQQGAPVPEISSAHDCVVRAKKLIEDRYYDQLRLDELSYEAGLSSFHLIRVFQRELGLPPHAYLAQVRVAKAKEMLARGMSIGEVALETGFVDQSHLTRRFKKLVGVTPGEFRRGISKSA